MVDGIQGFGGNHEQKKAMIHQKLSSLGVPNEIITQGREAVRAYCEENGIELPTPGQRPNFGSIFAGQAQQGQRPDKAQIAQMLMSLGVPLDIIQQGPDAVKTYAEQNDIDLPMPRH